MNLSQSYHDSPSSELTLERVREALEQGGYKPKRDANGFRSICPAHAGADGANFTVHPRDGGGVLMQCHSRHCEYQDILKALGLWQERKQPSASPAVRDPIPSSHRKEGGSIVYGYLNEARAEVYQNVRKQGKKFAQRRVLPDGSWEWGLGGLDQIPYGLPELVDPRYSNLIVHVCEGEKDSIRLRDHGILATSISDGAMREQTLKHFDGRHIVIHEDNDEAGRKRSARLVEWFGDAAASIRIMKYDDLPEKGDVSDWWDAGGTPAKFHKRLAALKPVEVPSVESEWQIPDPLDPGHGPPFDTSLLPTDLREFVEHQSAAFQVPVDMAVTIALGTISAAVGGWYELSIQSRGWREPVHGMFIAVARPGLRKSAIISRFTRALIHWQAGQQELDRLDLAEWESTERKLKRDQERLEGPPRKGEEAGENREMLRRAAVRDLFDHQQTKPVVTVIVTDDATPQAVTGLLIEQRGRLAVVSAESAYLENIAGRYSDSPDLNTFLHGHAGESLHEHRRNGRNGYVESANLTLCMAVQPYVIERMGGVAGFQERGGSSRLLMAIPRDIAGERLTGRNVPSVPAHIDAWWDQMLTRLLKTRHDATSKTRIPMSPEATSAVERFEALVETRYQFLGNDDVMRGWLSKQTGAAMRIAGLLHVVSGNPTDPIAKETIERGIEISEWYREHAAIAFKMMEGSDDSAARIVWDAITAMDSDPITRSDIHLKLRGRSDFKKASDLDAPLELLEDLGYIRMRKVETGKRGRPTVLIDINPLALNSPELSSANGSRAVSDDTGGLRLVGEAI